MSDMLALARRFRQEGIERFQDLTKSLTSRLLVVCDSVAPISTPNGRAELQGSLI